MLPIFSSNLPLFEQIDALKQQIRKSPSSAPLRIFYFQLLCVIGEWRKALEQLQVCAQLAPETATMAKAYRETIRCEAFRTEVFGGLRKPFLVGEPSRWLALMVDALEIAVKNSVDAAQSMRAQALDLAPTVAGCIDQQNFDWIADSDTRLGPVCEIFSQGRYYWVPFENVISIRFEEVSDLRDLVWMPCEVTLANGGALLGFMPSRYPLVGNDSDDLMLSRCTRLVSLGGDHVAGRGQRAWTTESSDYAMLQVRQITLVCGG